jgi:hypothetical protein
VICRVILIFRKCIKAEEKITVALRYVLVIVVGIKINYIRKMLNATKIQCNLKGDYTRKSKSYTKLKYTTDLQSKNKNINDTELTHLLEIFQSIKLRRRNW